MILHSLSRRRFLGAAVVGGALFYPGAASRLAKEAKASVELGPQQREALAALPLARGRPFTPDEIAGRPIVVNFFASWCPPCRIAFDQLIELDARAQTRGFEILAVNTFEERAGAGGQARLMAYLKDKAPRFRVLSSGESVIPLFGKVDRIPTLFLFGPDGRVIQRFVPGRKTGKSHLTYKEIDTALQRAL